MNLGNILKQKNGTPETGRPVRFQLRQKQKDGTYRRVWADALLLPVSAAAVSRITAEVSEWLGENPHATRDDEINLRFLVEALRDAERPALQFCLSDSVDDFAAAITTRAIVHLHGEYNLMLREQYPEFWPTAKARDRAEDDAEDFSEDGQD